MDGVSTARWFVSLTHVIFHSVGWRSSLSVNKGHFTHPSYGVGCSCSYRASEELPEHDSSPLQRGKLVHPSVGCPSIRSCQFHWRMCLPSNSQSHSILNMGNRTGRHWEGLHFQSTSSRRQNSFPSKRKIPDRCPSNRRCQFHCRMCCPSNSQSHSSSNSCNRRSGTRRRGLRFDSCFVFVGPRHGGRNRNSPCVHHRITSNSRISLIHHHFSLARRSGDIIVVAQGLRPKELFLSPASRIAPEVPLSADRVPFGASSLNAIRCASTR